MNFKRLDEFMDELTAWRIPGNDIIIYYKNELIHRYMSGYADVEAGKRMSGNELFYLYSCSKLTTCTAALQLLEQGSFLLSDPLYEYIPEYRHMNVRRVLPNGAEVIEPAKNTITIGDLFSMSAGFSYNSNTPEINAVLEEKKGEATTLDVIRALAKSPLLYEPGTHWYYSLAHDVLAAVVEVVSGKRFSTYVHDNIFAPLDMKDSSYKVTQPERMAQQYRFNDETGKAEIVGLNNSYVFATNYESGGAGIISTTADYAKFVTALANYGVGANGARILSKSTVNMMRTNRLSPEMLKDFNWIQMTGYGYGLGVRTVIDRSKGVLSPIGEFGWGGAAGAYALIDPENSLAVYYEQHLLNNQEPYVHPRLRNIIYGNCGIIE